MDGNTRSLWGMGLGAMEVEAARRREVLLGAAGSDRVARTQGRGSLLGRLVSALTGHRRVASERSASRRPVGRPMTEA